MSGKELRADGGGVVHDPTPDQLRRAGVVTVSYCLANQLPYADMVDLLGAVGVLPSVGAGKTSPDGKNITPAAQAKDRERNAASKRAARARKKAS